jgi:hypothetical protein
VGTAMSAITPLSGDKQRSSQGVLSFRSEAPTAPTSIQDLLACGEVIERYVMLTWKA